MRQGLCRYSARNCGPLGKGQPIHQLHKGSSFFGAALHARHHVTDDLGVHCDLAIRKQFHHLVRTVPAAGRILWNAGDANLEAVLDMGCWTPREGFARDDAGAAWSLRVADGGDYSAFEVLESGRHAGMVRMC